MTACYNIIAEEKKLLEYFGLRTIKLFNETNYLEK